jgi:succinylglutamate desuccinylase
VYVIERLERQSAAIKRDHPSLEVETLLVNPEAHANNRRFIDDDINRLFSEESLTACGSPKGYEHARAKEVAAVLGGSNTALSIDLHTTTSNMGCTLIVSTYSSICVRAAAYVQQQWAAACEADAAALRARLGGAGGATELPVDTHPLRVLLADGESQSESSHLCSVVPDGLEIEVGPVPNGLVRADAVASTERALRLLLRFFDQCHAGQSPQLPPTISAFLDRGKLPFDEGTSRGAHEGSAVPGSLVARSLQDRDFEPLHRGEPLFESLDGDIIPYDGSLGDPTYPMFINEAAYYYKQSGRGVAFASLVEWPLPEVS